MKKLIIFVTLILSSCAHERSATIIMGPPTVVTKRVDEGLLDFGRGPLYWDKKHLPISIVCSRNVSKSVIEALVEAVRYINKSVDISLFVLPIVRFDKHSFPVQEPIMRTVVINVHHKPGAYTLPFMLVETDRIGSASVVLPVEDSHDILKRMSIHELGHVLGLAHDVLKTSIMYPTLIESARELTEQDIQLLRKLYR